MMLWKMYLRLQPWRHFGYQNVSFLSFFFSRFFPTRRDELRIPTTGFDKKRSENTK